MKKIKENEEFQLGNQVFIYTLNESGGIVIKPVKKGKYKPSFVPPTLYEVKDYFKKEGYKEEIAIRAFNHYDKGNWTDSKGNAVKNWKQKIYTNWMKPEHKIKEREEEKSDLKFFS